MRKTVLVCGMTFGLGLLGAAHAHSPLRALAWISVSIGGLAAAAPIGWSVPSMIAPRGSVGTVGGIVNFANQLSGIAAPIITGYVVASTHSFVWAFRIAVGYLLVGVVSYIVLLGRIERGSGGEAGSSSRGVGWCREMPVYLGLPGAAVVARVAPVEMPPSTRRVWPVM